MQFKKLIKYLALHNLLTKGEQEMMKMKKLIAMLLVLAMTLAVCGMTSV